MYTFVKEMVKRKQIYMQNIITCKSCIFIQKMLLSESKSGKICLVPNPCGHGNRYQYNASGKLYSV